MSNYDQDLITDLISGRLSPQEREAALARLAQDPGLRSEYETQLAVSSLLGDTPNPVMTPEERAALRASLVQELHLDAAPAAVPAPPSRWQRWWAPVTGLAAAAAVIIGVVVILPGGSSDDSVELASAEVTTTVAASQSFLGDGGQSDESEVSASSDEPTTTAPAADAPSANAAGSETTTTAAASIEEAEALAGDAAAPPVPHLPSLDLDSLNVAYSAGGGELDDELKAARSATPPIDTMAGAACLDTGEGAIEAGAALEIIATTTVDDVASVVIAVTPSGEDAYLVAVDPSECRVLATTKP